MLLLLVVLRSMMGGQELELLIKPLPPVVAYVAERRAVPLVDLGGSNGAGESQLM